MLQTRISLQSIFTFLSIVVSAVNLPKGIILPELADKLQPIHAGPAFIFSLPLSAILLDCHQGPVCWPKELKLMEQLKCISQKPNISDTFSKERKKKKTF